MPLKATVKPDAVFRGERILRGASYVAAIEVWKHSRFIRHLERRIPRSKASTGGNEMKRATESEHAIALERIAKTDNRIANLKERIHAS